MSWSPVIFAVLSASALAQDGTGVRSYEGELIIPTYEHSGRETEPPLFANSSLAGMYPFTTYVMPLAEGRPAPKTYRAVFVENEYLKLTYLPDLGGRFFSLFDKLRGREVFYRNDTIKPASYNPRNSWPISGLELTGPHDLHMLTLKGEPFWSHSIQRSPDGAVSLVLGEYDPVYRMRVSLTATLHPGVAAMQVSVFAHNPNAARLPQMFWLSAGIAATPKLRFIYPMTRTVGHTTSDIADWPVHNGVDYSWDRNNRNMLGVFGIDIYDNFQGAYEFDRDFGVFRYADRRIVQGMKMWTFGYGPSAKMYEQGYTDGAGPYIEVQSGRHVWDGHYEWVEPHKTESWSEWWIPVAGTGGLTTLTKDIALNLDAQSASLSVVLGATRIIRNAKLTVRSGSVEALNRSIDLDPAKPFRVPVPGGRAEEIAVRVNDASGRVLLDYSRPGAAQPKREYTPFTRPLEEPRKPVERMSIEELVLGAEYALKELNTSTAQTLIEKALARDPGYSRAHLLLGIRHFSEGKYTTAAGHLEKAISRDPYSDEAHYYLAMSRLALGDSAGAARQLYFIWPGSARYGAREFFLGRQALLAGDAAEAAVHLEQAIAYGGTDLSSRFMMAIAQRELKQQAAALEQLAAVERLDPNHPVLWAERLFLTRDALARRQLARLMGGQGQEGLNVSALYRDLGRWKEAVEILRTVEVENKDAWGTAPEFHYVQAFCLRRSGDAAAADAALRKARASAGNVDRFPYREDSEAALAEAVSLDPNDAVARFAFGCLLYHRQRPAEAVAHWEKGLASVPSDFSLLRALGLAYAGAGAPVEKSGRMLEAAVAANPAHLPTWNDLSALYGAAGRFKEQRSLLERALLRRPGDDGLTESLLAAMLNSGQYEDAERLLATHKFAPRHRTYSLRNKYRMMRIAQGARAFDRKDYAAALTRFESAMRPPTSLGLDDFTNQSSPRIDYLRGRALEAQGRTVEARQAYEQSVAGIGSLSGDRDSWNTENFYLTLTLRRIGRAQEAAALEKRFENFALGEADSADSGYRAAANCLLGLLRKHSANPVEARRLFAASLAARQDWLESRLELSGDSLDPLPKN